ncbi:MAG: DUF4270 family protein [Chryseosolibacter sp.]
MNLSVRTLRQLAVLAVALFFFSCEDETSILGFKNPNKKFQVAFVDIPLGVSNVLAVDSIITDLRPSVVNGQTSFADGLLVGEYTDAALGKVKAQSFVTIYPLSNTALPSSAVFDSVTVQFRLNFYGYGFSGNHVARFAIHEITGDTLSFFNGNRYYASSPAPQVSVSALGEAVVSVHADSLQKQAVLTSRQDTLFAKGKLSDEFGQRLFLAVKPGLTNAGQQSIFKSQIRGLALLPSGDPGVVGMNVVNTFGQLSQVTLHYHTLTDAGAVDDTLSRFFGINFTSFTKIETDRTGTELESIVPYESIQTLSGNRYIQGGAGILTKLDLAPFYAFADTLDNLLVNSAELVIDNIQSSPGQKPFNSLMLRLMKNTADEYLNGRVAADREMFSQSPYFVLQDGSYFAPSDDITSQPNPVTFAYDAEKNQYSGYMTLFAQSLFMNKNDGGVVNENRLRYLALLPLNPSIQRSVTRTVFDENNVKLRIYYTRPNAVTP